jgi:hypothetical protein
MESPPTEKARIDAKSYNKWKKVVPENILELFFVGVHTGDVCQGLDEILTVLLFAQRSFPDQTRTRTTVESTNVC